MSNLIKFKNQSFLKWVSLNLTQINYSPSKSSLRATGSYPIALNPRFYSTKKVVGTDVEIPCNIRAEAQSALIDYLHNTSGLEYPDAEHISKNSPMFLGKLLKEVQNKKDVRRSITRFLRYHPINEFEPFFESMGLEPSDYSSYLPRDMTFIRDDQVLLDNYHFLYAFGVSKNNMGKIYKEANEVFRYDRGVLESKMRSFQEMGIDQTSVVKIVISCPHLLVGNTVQDFLKVLERLKTLGISLDGIADHLSEEESYSWCHMLELFCLFNKLGFSDEQLGRLLSKHPAILLDAGSTTIPLIGYLMKFGSSPGDLISMFLQLPEIHFRIFVSNLGRGHDFFIELGMEFLDIAKLVCSYPVLIGSLSLRKTKSLMRLLNCGKKRIRDILNENPQELKKWTLGSKVNRLPSSVQDEIILQKAKKTKFLLDLGYVENSNEIEKAFRVFRGKGGELRERFDCLVNAGLDQEDVKKMVKVSPNILNQTKENVKMKLDCLQNLGYPISYLVAYPSYLNFSIRRVKLRVSMYNWLKDQGAVSDDIALGTIVGWSDTQFIAHFVTRTVNDYPNGPEVWETLKKQIYAE